MDGRHLVVSLSLLVSVIFIFCSRLLLSWIMPRYLSPVRHGS